MIRVVPRRRHPAGVVLADGAKSSDPDGGRGRFRSRGYLGHVDTRRADYEGVCLRLPVDLAGAALKLKLDLSFGDPVKPQRIDYPRLLDDQTFEFLAYPLENVIAEKAETMTFLGDANTRDRDYGDIYLLSEIHAVDAESLRRALKAVAEHRRHEPRPLGPQLERLRQTRQQPWAAFRARVGLAGLPERFSEVVDRVVEVVDGVDDESVSRWHPAERRSK